MNIHELNRLRMLADWQLRELGHDPEEITRLCAESDERNPAVLAEIDHALSRFTHEDIEVWIARR